MTTRRGTLRVGTRAQRARPHARPIWSSPRSACPVEIVPIVTEGDRSSEALAADRRHRRVRLGAARGAAGAARSTSPSTPTRTCRRAAADGIVVAAVPAREDPRDALVARDGLTLGELPAGARVGTGSPRRAAQLRALGLGPGDRAVRGNVDTRLRRGRRRRAGRGRARLAGLRRLGRDDEVTEILDPIQMLPAPAQGALAIECRASDDDGRARCWPPLDHPDTRAAVAAERALLAALEAGCSAPGRRPGRDRRGRRRTPKCSSVVR